MKIKNVQNINMTEDYLSQCETFQQCNENIAPQSHSTTLIKLEKQEMHCKIKHEEIFDIDSEKLEFIYGQPFDELLKQEDNNLKEEVFDFDSEELEFINGQPLEELEKYQLDDVKKENIHNNSDYSKFIFPQPLVKEISSPIILKDGDTQVPTPPSKKHLKCTSEINLENILVAPQQPTRKYRRVHCRECESCKKPDCKNCMFCLDKYLKVNRLKQRCIGKKCQKIKLCQAAICYLCSLKSITDSHGIDCPLMECSECSRVAHIRCQEYVCNGRTGNILSEMSNYWQCPECVPFLDDCIKISSEIVRVRGINRKNITTQGFSGFDSLENKLTSNEKIKSGQLYNRPRDSVKAITKLKRGKSKEKASKMENGIQSKNINTFRGFESSSGIESTNVRRKRGRPFKIQESKPISLTNSLKFLNHWNYGFKKEAEKIVEDICSTYVNEFMDVESLADKVKYETNCKISADIEALSDKVKDETNCKMPVDIEALSDKVKDETNCKMPTETDKKNKLNDLDNDETEQLKFMTSKKRWTGSLLFSTMFRKAITNKLPNASFIRICQAMGSEWKMLPDEKKKVYRHAAIQINKLKAAQPSCKKRNF